MTTVSSSATRRIYRCGRCGQPVPSHRAMFSKFTRKHYCMDVDGCARRAGTYRR